MIVCIKKFEELVCPICKGELTYGGSERVAGYHRWTCTSCGATGREGYDEDYEFDGQHYYVQTADGEDVQFQFVEELETITPEEARADILTFLQAQGAEFFAERNTTKEAVLADEETLEKISTEHLRCVNRFGCQRDWSCEDACTADPSCFVSEDEESVTEAVTEEPDNRVTVKYQDIGICPICGADDCEVVREDNGYGEVWYECSCECGASWRQDLSVIEVNQGYSEVRNAAGEEVEVTIEDAPIVAPSDVIPLLTKCRECDSDICAFNPDGICKYALVYGKAPEITEGGCMSLILKPNDNWLEGIELGDDQPIRSSTEGDYNPSSPWNAPGMSAKDFIR